MKILEFHPLVWHIATYHFLSCFVIVMVAEVNGVLGRSDLRTKLLLQNIRTHLAQKVDEIAQQKECESGLTLCKNIKPKMEGDEEKSEEIQPPPKVARGHHKPLIRVSPKDVIHTMMPKVQKSLLKKFQKKEDAERYSKIRQLKEDESEESVESIEKKETKRKASVTTQKPIPTKPKPFVEVKEKFRKNIDTLPVKDAKAEMKTKPKPQEPDEIRKKMKKDEDDKKKKPKTEETLSKERLVKSKRIEFEKPEEKKKMKKVERLKTEDKKAEKDERMKKKKEEETEEEDEHPAFSAGIFVFALDSDEIKTDFCRKHSQIYLSQLKKFKIWALMMYDASAKLPSGILQGNINQYGDFDECLSINAVFKKSKLKEPSGIRGKYCLANIDVSTDWDKKGLRQALNRTKSYSFITSTIADPGHFIPKFTSINWGLCVPSSCPAEDVEKYIKSQLGGFKDVLGVAFNVSVKEENCAVKDDFKFKFEMMVSLTILFYLITVGTAIYATYIDSTDKKRKLTQTEKIEIALEEASKDISTKEKDLEQEFEATEFTLKRKIQDIIMAFSLKRNLKKLFSDGESSNTIECINGIKSVFTVMLYFAHKTIPLGMTPFNNRIFLTKISNETSTVLFRTSMIYTDSFLLISGVLTSYNFSKEISIKGKISWTRKAIARFLRLTPALFAVIAFYAYVWDHLGSGPAWNVIIKKNSELCRKYMWRNLLYIQNLFAFEDMCAPQTHQLALDMQLSLFAPFFVQILYKYDKVGVGVMQALFLLSSIMRYISTSNNSLSVVIYHGMSVSQLYETANLLYSQTLHRATPYLMGSIVGFYLKKYETQLDLPKAFAALGWILAFCLGFYSVASPSHLALRSYQYDVHEAAQYAALSPVAWSFALAWFIIACHLGFGGKVNKFLCNKTLLVFSRISYSVYLTQFLVFFYKIGVQRAPEMFTFAGSFNVTEFSLVTIISTVLTLLFDLPMSEIKRIILDERSANVKALKGEPKTPERKETEESEQESLTEEEALSQEESQERLEDMSYPEEEIEEGEETEGDEVAEDVEMEEEESEEEDVELKPLRRSSRFRFDEDESEDKEWIKIRDEGSKEDEERD